MKQDKGVKDNQGPPKDNKDEEPTPVTIFQGSSPEDIEHAKSFWKSLTLHPPLESRLVSADIRQRLKVAPSPSKVQRRSKNDIPTLENELFLNKAREQERFEERERYRYLASKREAVINLLHKQRGQRIEKEKISRNCL
ncbi:cilia- and flagella-associated protein HOATZ-like [Clavelina lepadiformis]|uniref:Cilia- and flagella-associated protein HOATZ n=1 Tax=Clavelina lepadiformis TaxID=159417 RepID=A0ABP0FE52_CLALP